MAQIGPCGDGRLGNPEESNLCRCLVLEGVCSSHHRFWGRQVSSASLSCGFECRGGAGQDWEKISFSVIHLWIKLWYETAARLH